MTPKEIIDIMTARDEFSRWLGLEIDLIDTGYCKLHYTVKREMLNGFGHVHGGILFSASDSAFAFAGNSHGIVSVALDVSITFTHPANEGDVLTVEAKELHLGHKTGLYQIHTTNSEGKLIAAFKGTAYRTKKAVSEIT